MNAITFNKEKESINLKGMETSIWECLEAEKL